MPGVYIVPQNTKSFKTIFGTLTFFAKIFFFDGFHKKPYFTPFYPVFFVCDFYWFVNLGWAHVADGEQTSNY